MQVNSRALRAAALFTSTDGTRPTLGNVEVSEDGSLMIATDSYKICAIGKAGELPSSLVGRIKAGNHGDAVQVSADAINKASKLTSRFNPACWEISDSTIAASGGTVTLEKGFGEFPNVSTLVAWRELVGIKEVAFDSSFFATIHKATQVLYGTTKSRKGDIPMPPIVFHGAQEGDRNITLLSVSSEAGTMVVMMISISRFVGWDGAQ